VTGSPEADPPETGAPIVYDVVIMERAFQVDLRGGVDLLSHHLYTGPRVSVR